MATKTTKPNDSNQTGVETSTTGTVGEAGGVAIGNAPVGTENSNAGGGEVQANENAGAQTGTETGGNAASDQTGGEKSKAEQITEGQTAPLSLEDLTRKPKNLSEFAEGEKPLAQHSEEVKVRNEATVAEGGEETVGAGVHKGRKIVNGAVDFSTPSDREKRIAANKKTAKENAAKEAETAGEEKKAA